VNKKEKNDKNMAISIEKSEEQAAILTVIILMLDGLDAEYLAEVAVEMKNNALRMDSAAPLIAGYDPDDSRLIRTKAEALMHLCEFKNGLKEAQMLEDKVSSRKKQQQSINELFGL
jgi:hypothetical protein